MRRWSHISLTCLALLVWALQGCVTAPKGPPPPDFSSSRDRIEKTQGDLARAREAIESDIGSLRSSSGTFFDAEPRLYVDPFPLDLFRHTAMSCLNTPLDPRGDVLPVYRDAAEEAGITCPVPPVGPLLDALGEETPGRRGEALRRLQLIDTWRRSRARVQDRLRQLPRIIEQTREWIASERASTRQTELELERRRAEYSEERMEESRERIATLRERLDQLEDQVDAIESTMPAWSRAVGTEIDFVYSRLSLLGPT